MEDRALHRLYKRHQRLLGEFLRAFHGGQVCDAMREEIVVVDAAIWAELCRRGHARKEPLGFEAAYDDPNSIFVQTYVQLDNIYNLRT